MSGYGQPSTVETGAWWPASTIVWPPIAHPRAVEQRPRPTRGWRAHRACVLRRSRLRLHGGLRGRWRQRRRGRPDRARGHGRIPVPTRSGSGVLQPSHGANARKRAPHVSVDAARQSGRLARAAPAAIWSSRRPARRRRAGRKARSRTRSTWCASGSSSRAYGLRPWRS